MPAYEGGGELGVAPALPPKVPIFNSNVYCTLGQRNVLVIGYSGQFALFLKLSPEDSTLASPKILEPLAERIAI